MFDRLKSVLREFVSMPARLDSIHRSIGRIERRQTLSAPNSGFNDSEFQVSSQWGETVWCSS